MYFNSKTEPSDGLNRQLSITLSDSGFTPCSVDISIMNMPDAPVINLPEKYVLILNLCTKPLLLCFLTFIATL